MAKARRKLQPQARTNDNRIINISNYHRKNRVEIIPRNYHQDEMIGHLEDENVYITFAIGPAGTGKTLIATLYGIKLLKEHQIKKLIISRPNIAVDGRDIGFLPGSIYDKMLPWVKPILDIMEEYWSPKYIAEMISEGIIEICPVAHLRGRTFKDSFVIIDEAQNTTPTSMKSILTRLGENSAMVITGDIEQSDHSGQNGLGDIVSRFEKTTLDMIKFINFGINDVERHKVVKEVLQLYKD